MEEQNNPNPTMTAAALPREDAEAVSPVADAETQILIPEFEIRVMEEDLKGIKRSPATGPKLRQPELKKSAVAEKTADGLSDSPRETKLAEPPAGLPVDEPKTILSEPKNSALSIERELEPEIARAGISAKPAPPETDSRQEAQVFFKEGVSLWQRKFFQEAAGQFQKAAEHPAASFILKKRAERLLKKALQKVDKKDAQKQRMEQKNFAAAKTPAEITAEEIAPATIAPEIFLDESENRSEKPLQPITEENRFSLKRIGLVLGGLILIAAVALAAFWFFTQEKELAPLPKTPEAPAIQPAGTPEKLVSGQFQEALDFEDKSSFPEQFQESLAKETRNGFFKNLFVKKVVNYKEEWLSLDELVALFSTQFPAEIRNRLSGGYNLLVYQQPTADGSTPFDGRDFLADKRLLLVLDISEKEGLQEALSAWEGQMAQDMAPFLFFGKNTPVAENATYLENFYRGAFIRYLNFPQPDLSLDYLIIDQMLVLATSRESTFAAIDKVMENL